MLASPCLRDDLLLAHPFSQQDLTKGIVNLVSSCMVEVFPFQVDLRSTDMFGETFCVVKWSLPTYIILEQVIQFRLKTWIYFGFSVRLIQFDHGCHQGFWDKLAPKFSIKPFFIR